MQTQSKKSANGSKNLQALVLILLLGIISFTTFKLTRQKEKISKTVIVNEKLNPGLKIPFAEISNDSDNNSNEIKHDNKVYSTKNSFHPEDQKSKYHIIPPVAELTQQPFTQQVKTNRGAFIKYKSGTQIIIPPGAFVDKKGKQVTGDVDIAYKEYRNAYDFFISGIPMNYDSGGKTFQFESAGMMELTACLNNEAVYINPKKKIRVNLASDTRETDYNLYFFDPQKGNWVNKGKDAARVILDTVQNSDANAVAEIRPRMYAFVPLNRNNFTLYCSECTPPKRLTLFSKIKKTGEFIFRFKAKTFSAYPEFKSFRSSGWMYKDKDAIAVYEKLFRKKYSKNNLASVSDYWNGVSLTHEPGSDDFTFSFYSDSDLLTIPVYAVQGNKKITSDSSPDRLVKRTEAKYEKYKAAVDKINKSEILRYERYRQDSTSFVSQGGIIYNPVVSKQLVRSFEVDGFGIWNCDRIIDQKNAVTMKVKFVDPENKELPLDNVYLVDSRINSIITYYPEGFNGFRFNPGAQNIIWAILPDNRLAYVEPSDFETIKKGDKEHTFKMKVLVNAVEGMKEIRKTFRI
ncbi:MAG: hypothetical protein ABI855_04885 [Bacteroidota bacterium]